MPYRRFPFALTVALLAAAPAWTALGAELAPQAVERVAATINQEAVTFHDLDARVGLALLAAALPDTEENRRRLVHEVLLHLVDERLQLQEADRLKITIGKAEIEDSFVNLEKQNHMPKGGLAGLLESKGIDPQTLRDQIHAQLAWVQVVRQQLVPTLNIGEEEIDARLALMKEAQNKPSYLLADIFLAVDDPSRDAAVHELGDRLFQQLRAGAPFSGLARQFSQSGAAAGGDLGWVSAGMIDDALLTAVEKLQPGEASPPIRGHDGYHILLLREKRARGEKLSTEPDFDLAQIDLTTLPSEPQSERRQTAVTLRGVVGQAKTCDDYERLARSFVSAHYTRTGLIRLEEMPDEVKQLIVGLKQGQMSEPLVLDNVFRFFIVCGITEPIGGLPSRDDVKRRIENEKIELLATRYLRDLRRAAFVELRL